MLPMRAIGPYEERLPLSTRQYQNIRIGPANLTGQWLSGSKFTRKSSYRWFIQINTIVSALTEAKDRGLNQWSIRLVESLWPIQMFKDYIFCIEDQMIKVDRIILDLFGLDVILGMDWLAINYAFMDCYKKKKSDIQASGLTKGSVLRGVQETFIV